MPFMGLIGYDIRFTLLLADLSVGSTPVWALISGAASVHTFPFLILFDCDGTLMDSQHAIVRAMQDAFRQNALPEPDEAAVRAVIGLSLSEAVKRLAGESSGQAKIVEDYRTLYRAHEDQVRLYPSVHETLQELRQRGYWLGVVTGKSRAGLKRALEGKGLSNLFYVMRTADCCLSKPHPAMVLECMDEMGVNAERTSVVGDAIFDIQMAAAAGVAAMGVSYGVSSGNSLRAAGADAIVENFSDLLGYFPALRGVQEAALRTG